MSHLKEVLDKVKGFLSEKDYPSLHEFLNDFLTEDFNGIKDERRFIRDNLACCETRVKGYQDSESQDVVLDLIKLNNYIGASSLVEKSSVPAPAEQKKKRRKKTKKAENKSKVSERFESWSEE